MRNIRIYILFSLLTQISFGQNPYKFSSQILSAYHKDTTSLRDDVAAWDLGNIGEYQLMLCVWDTGRYIDPIQMRYHHPRSTNLTLSSNDSLYFSKFKPKNAVEYIAQMAKTEKIIIINEAHQQPMHRVFTESLLQALYDNGFRYFGAETLDYTDSTLNERRYPVLKSGGYTVEPQYGNLIRSALRIGYTVFAYETRNNSDGKQREIDQANNIKQILIKDSTAEIFLHCGFGHNTESYVGGALEYLMGGRLKEFTGIDPLTINQIDMTETSSIKYDDPYFKRTTLDYDAVFVDSTGQTFYGKQGYKFIDMQVYHPRTKWIDGRPNWVFKNNKVSVSILKHIKIGFPCLVLAYMDNEDIYNVTQF